MPKTVGLLARLSRTLGIPQAAINSLLFVTEHQLEHTILHWRPSLLLKLCVSYPSHEAHEQCPGLCVMLERKSLVSSYLKVFPLTRKEGYAF